MPWDRTRTSLHQEGGCFCDDGDFNILNAVRNIYAAPERLCLAVCGQHTTADTAFLGMQAAICAIVVRGEGGHAHSALSLLRDVFIISTTACTTRRRFERGKDGRREANCAAPPREPAIGAATESGQHKAPERRHAARESAQNPSVRDHHESPGHHAPSVRHQQREVRHRAPSVNGNIGTLSIDE